MKKLSVVLATHNEENNIKKCLLSVKNLADEVVIIDGSSYDKTVALARKLGAKVFVESNQLMFHKNKQLALEKANGEWILQLDADERITPKLQQEILLLINRSKRHLPARRCYASSVAGGRGENINGYFIPRKNYFLGKWLKKGGQYPDYVIRLVRKDKAFFPCKTVHEQIEVAGKTAYLTEPLIHLTYPNLKTYWDKARIYTEETAYLIAKEKNNFFIKPGKYLLVKSLYTFINLYFRHKGFVDSWQGFLFAFFSGFHFPIAYIKSLRIKK